MGNTLGSNEGALVARQALDTLLAEFPFFGRITTDFSAEASLFNQDLNIKLPTALTAGAYSTANGYVAQDVTQADVQLTIDQHVHVTYTFNDQELSGTNQNLIQRFGRNAGHAIGTSIMSSIMALPVVANYTNETVVTVANMDSGEMLGVADTLDGRKVPKMGRFAILAGDYYKALAADTTLIANAGSPSPTVRSGVLGDVYGFHTERYAVPDNSENLHGIAGSPDSIVVAARVPKIPEGADLNCSIENVTEPNTGLTIQVRTWYAPKEGALYATFTLMYGVAVGNASSLERLVTVSNS